MKTTTTTMIIIIKKNYSKNMNTLLKISKKMRREAREISIKHLLIMIDTLTDVHMTKYPN